MVVRFDKETDRLLRERAKEFGEVMTETLRLLGLTQYGLSDKANLPPETVNRITRGRRAATEVQVLRMGSAALMSAEQRWELSLMLEIAQFDPMGGFVKKGRGHNAGRRTVLPRRRSA